MAEAAIPVDPLNPGQVFACLGFMEAAEALLGDAEGGFEWSGGAQPRFLLRAAGEQNPFAGALAFVADAEVAEAPADGEFCAPRPDKMALPVALRSRRLAVVLSHWADGSGREPFKTYAGNRTAAKICTDMAQAIAGLHRADAEGLARDPLGRLAPLGGAFGWDARKAWNGVSAGHSPDKAGEGVAASPVAELFAAWGLQDARPSPAGARVFQYGLWRPWLPLPLARVALGGAAVCNARLRFEFESSGKNKVARFANWEAEGYE